MAILHMPQASWHVFAHIELCETWFGWFFAIKALSNAYTGGHSICEIFHLTLIVVDWLFLHFFQMTISQAQSTSLLTQATSRRPQLVGLTWVPVGKILLFLPYSLKRTKEKKYLNLPSFSNILDSSESDFYIWLS